MCIPLSDWTRRSRQRVSPSNQVPYTRSRLTQTAMQLPILVIACSSRLWEIGSRLRQSAVIKVNEPVGVGDDGEVLVEEAPVSVGREALMTKSGDYRFFFGWRSDPFFF